MKYLVILGIIGISFLSFHLQETEARTIPQLSIWLDEGTIKQNSFITADGGVPDITIQKGDIVSFPLTVSSHGSESLPVNFFHSIEYAISDTRQSMLPDMKIELDPFYMILKPDEPQLLNVTITALNYTQLGEHKIKLTAQYPQGETLLNTRFDVLVIDENQYENYRFIDFTYANKIGEPIQFILEKTRDANCNSYNAKITDDEGNFILGWGEEILCDPATSPTLIQTKIGYKENKPIIINESGKYYLEVEFDDASIKQEFVVRQNHVGGSLDRTVYPVPWMIEPTLKQQLVNNVDHHDIECPSEKQVLVLRPNDKLACVFFETADKLQWTTLEPVNGTYEIIKNNKAFFVDYFMPEGKVISMSYDEDANSILANLKIDVKKSVFYIHIPRALVDVLQTYCDTIMGDNSRGGSFMILLNGEEITHSLFDNTNNKNTLLVPLIQNYTSLEFVGMCYA